MPVAAVDPTAATRSTRRAATVPRVTGTPIIGANVVLDPGHGGNETGAVGPGGLVEKDVNFAVAQDVKQLLEAQGATVVLTRTADYNTTIKTRAEIAVALHPQVFLSIHHNAEPDGPSDVPGNESYYQIASPRIEATRRVAVGGGDERVRAVPRRVGGRHGSWREVPAEQQRRRLLRHPARAAGITTVLSEAAFISNPPEEQLLADPAFRHVEAEAIANAIAPVRGNADPGSGFVTPYPRTEPAGGGGGPEGCTDPPL